MTAPQRDRSRVSRRRTFKRARRRIGRWLVERTGPRLLGALARTWKVDVRGRENLAAARGAEGGVILALWHGRMLLPLPHHAHQGWHVLVSGSGDGDVSQALLQGCGYNVIRGSTSRGGAQALREMLVVLRVGAGLVITPDGPRGPRHSMNSGPAWLGRATGYALLPCGFVCDRAWRLSSWDRFAIPKPWAKVLFAYGEPVRVAREGGDEELERASLLLRERMLAAERQGFAQLGQEPDW